jgi:hypothetical protein
MNLENMKFGDLLIFDLRALLLDLNLIGLVERSVFILVFHCSPTKSGVIAICLKMTFLRNAQNTIFFILSGQKVDF